MENNFTTLPKENIIRVNDWTQSWLLLLLKFMLSTLVSCLFFLEVTMAERLSCYQWWNLSVSTVLCTQVNILFQWKTLSNVRSSKQVSEFLNQTVQMWNKDNPKKSIPMLMHSWHISSFFFFCVLTASNVDAAIPHLQTKSWWCQFDCSTDGSVSQVLPIPVEERKNHIFVQVVSPMLVEKIGQVLWKIEVSVCWTFGV